MDLESNRKERKLVKIIIVIVIIILSIMRVNMKRIGKDGVVLSYVRHLSINF